MSEASENTPSRDRYQKAVAWCSTNASWLVPASAILALILILIVVKQTVELHGQYAETNWGNVAEAFGAAGTLLAVVVALWQSLVIRRQAAREATEAAARFERELTSARELHAAEMKAADDRHQAELEAQRELARVQRLHLREQEFKLALIRVSRAANAFTHELATLIEQGRRVVKMQSRQEREDALLPISERLDLLAQDVALEINGAHMLTINDQLHEALDNVNVTVLEGPQVEMAFRDAIINAGQTPNPGPVIRLMARVQGVLGDTRRLAGRLLVTGWD